MSKERLQKTINEFRRRIASGLITTGMGAIGAEIEVRAQGPGARGYPVLQGRDAIEEIMKGREAMGEGEPTQKAKMTLVEREGRKVISKRKRIPKR